MNIASGLNSIPLLTSSMNGISIEITEQNPLTWGLIAGGVIVIVCIIMGIIQQDPFIALIGSIGIGLNGVSI